MPGPVDLLLFLIFITSYFLIFTLYVLYAYALLSASWDRRDDLESFHGFVQQNDCRSRLRGMHSGSLQQQKGALKHVGGSGETYLEFRRQLLKVIQVSFDRV